MLLPFWEDAINLAFLTWFYGWAWFFVGKKRIIYIDIPKEATPFLGLYTVQCN